MSSHGATTAAPAATTAASSHSTATKSLERSTAASWLGTDLNQKTAPDC
jgi:hypothetical protein